MTSNRAGADHVTTSHDTARRPLNADPGNGPPGPLVWQRTDTVGTELVFQTSTAQPTATGSAVVAGPLPHTTHWHADLDGDWAVRALTVTTRGSDWTRTVRLARDDDGWTCRTEETGDLGRSLSGSGHPAPPLPGIDDPDRLNAATLIRIDDSPVFLTWAMRRLRLIPGDKPVAVATVRVLTPSLVVQPGTSTYQLIRENRVRVGGDEPAAFYDLDHAGIVTYQAGRLRLAR
jgi:uncharacterized protein